MTPKLRVILYCSLSIVAIIVMVAVGAGEDNVAKWLQMILNNLTIIGTVPG